MHRPWITRFAPSPTGHLHLGHLFSALWTYGTAAYLDAEVVFRIENHDQQRCKDEYAHSILSDLRFFGFIDDSTNIHNQSSRTPIYQSLCDELVKNASAYFCNCSRKEIQSRNPVPNKELQYDQHCRFKNINPEESSAPCSIRFAVNGSDYEFKDLRHGWRKQNPLSQCGDFSLKDKNGLFTYQCCVCKDDLDQRINLIIRGDDLLESTGRQLALRRAISDAQDPVYLHHPLIYDRQEKRKLSKRFSDTPLRNYQNSGWSSNKILTLCLQHYDSKIGPVKSLSEAYEALKIKQFIEQALTPD